VVAGVTFVVILFASSVQGVFSLLIQPLMTEFGWSRSVTTLPASVNILVYGITGPFAAALTVRFGLRMVVTGALLAVATGALLVTQSSSPWQLVIAWGIIVGVGMGCMATVLASTVAAAWFVEKQGMVMGLLVAAGTAGQLVFIPVNRLLVQSFTWRAAAFVIASATICAVPLVVLFIRNKPEDKGLTALGAPVGWRTPDRPDHPIRLAFQGLWDASQSGMFWILGGSFLVCGASTSGLVQIHWFESTSDHNIAKATASTLLVGIGVFDLLGSLASGWLSDRVDPRRLLFAYYGLRGLSLLMLDQVLDLGPSNPGLLIVLVFYGLDWVATVPPTIKLAHRLFGPGKGSVVYGWLFAAHQLGGAFAAWFSATTRDSTGSFQLSFVIGGVLCIVAALGVLRINLPSRVLDDAITRDPALV
jgi:predicted MFS family arabinose efflux permease